MNQNDYNKLYEKVFEEKPESDLFETRTELAKDLIAVIKRNKLTYHEAYASLLLAYKMLEHESQYTNL